VIALSYVLLVFLTQAPMRGFTSVSTCGMNVEVTSARILLSLSHLFPDTGTGSGYRNRTFVSSFAQPSVKQGLQYLTLFQIGKAYPHPSQLFRKT
jgi:hypothetical protein